MILALVLSASAGDDACYACCRAGGLSTCASSIRIFGDGSRISREANAWRVLGVWTVGCDGIGSFDAGATLLLDHPPLGGELIMDPVSPLQVHCFQQACGLPVATCISRPDEDGRFFLQDCATGLPADAAAMGRASTLASRSGGTVVVLGGKPLVVQRVTGAGGGEQAAAAQPTYPAAQPTYPPTQPTYPAAQPSYPTQPAYPAAAPSYPAAQPVYPAVQPTDPAPPTSPTYAASAPVAVTPSQVASSAAAGDPFATFAASLPGDPPEVCKPPGDLLRTEARKRVEAGDDKRIVKDATGALQEYRAALSMDLCNAYAWLGIGEVAGGNARPDLAVRALRNATRILPGHYGAWTQLGRAYEDLKQMGLAAEAYSKALQMRPALQEALDGWRRTASPQ